MIHEKSKLVWKIQTQNVPDSVTHFLQGQYHNYFLMLYDNEELVSKGLMYLPECIYHFQTSTSCLIWIWYCTHISYRTLVILWFMDFFQFFNIKAWAGQRCHRIIWYTILSLLALHWGMFCKCTMCEQRCLSTITTAFLSLLDLDIVIPTTLNCGNIFVAISSLLCPFLHKHKDMYEHALYEFPS